MFGKIKKIIVTIALFVVLGVSIAHAHVLNKYMSIKSNQVNIRKGPGTNYPIEWVYQHKGLPVKVIETFENWRKITDYKNRTGWVHESLLTKTRYAIVINNKISHHNKELETEPNEALLFRRDSEYSYPTARIQIGVIGKIIKCKKNWCKISVATHKSWIQKHNLWGVEADELIS